MTPTTSVGQDPTRQTTSGPFAGNRAFSGFSCRDIEAAHAFYAGKLGLDASLDDGALTLRFPGGQRVMAYPKDEHEPATYTVLNIEVDDIDAAVDRLEEAGVSLERYGSDFDQDERGIARMAEGPPIAWFEDPSGNIVSVIETHDGP